MFTPQLLIESKCTLGEGPIYSQFYNSLLFVDILEKKLYKYSFSDLKLIHFDFEEFISCVVEIENEDDLLLTGHHSLYRFNLGTSKKSLLHKNIHDESNLRFNDGKCDPRGRFFFGSLDLEESRNIASLWMLEKGVLTKKMDGITISNGICWNCSGTLMYFVDSPTMTVKVYDYDIETTQMSNERILYKFLETDGTPDGMTIDRDDNLWIAMWGGSKVVNIDTKSKTVIQEIFFPCSLITSCCFGGTDYSDLFVTTASINTNNTTEPFAGSVWIVKGLNIRGNSHNKYASRDT